MAGRLVVSTLNDDTGVLQTQNGMSGIAKAWVNFDGGGTISTNQTIRASFNVSSVFKNGTGDYTVNFTTAMPNVNYSFAGNCSQDVGGAAGGTIVVNQGGTLPTASAFNLRVHRSTVSYVNATYIAINFFSS